MVHLLLVGVAFAVADQVGTGYTMLALVLTSASVAHRRTNGLRPHGGLLVKGRRRI
jgi:hypothetical protein